MQAMLFDVHYYMDPIPHIDGLLTHVCGMDFTMAEGSYQLPFSSGDLSIVPSPDGNQEVRMTTAASGKTYVHPNRVILNAPVVIIGLGIVNMGYWQLAERARLFTPRSICIRAVLSEDPNCYASELCRLGLLPQILAPLAKACKAIARPALPMTIDLEDQRQPAWFDPRRSVQERFASALANTLTYAQVCPIAY